MSEQTVCDHQFWSEKWSSDDTPWANGPTDLWLLGEHEKFCELGLKPGCKVLVPLCGNSIAVRFLWEKGHEVVAVEYVEKAVQSLIQTRFSDLEFTKSPEGVHSADRLSIHCGDFFQFKSESTFDFVYDRAALIALFPDQRKKYTKLISKHIGPKGFQCLVSFESDGDYPDVPPFPVTEEEIKQSYPDFETLLRSEAQIEELSEQMLERGVTKAAFKRYFMKRQA